MAHKKAYTGDNRAGLSHFYNVSYAVGSGAYNRRDDVQLVQFFLVKFFLRNPEFRPQGVRPIWIDGFYGPITFRHIMAFQKVLVQDGNSIYPDGRIDPSNSTGDSTISQTVYTIIHLNVGFHGRDPDCGYFDHLQDHPLIVAFAPELRAALLASQ
jgi:hypothetical protein